MDEHSPGVGAVCRDWSAASSAWFLVWRGSRTHRCKESLKVRTLIHSLSSLCIVEVMVRDVLEPLSSSQITSFENVHSCQEQSACLKWFSLSLSFVSAWKLVSTFQGTWGNCW